MSGLELDNLLDPVSSSEPAGEDLAYSPEFQQLLDAASGQPERIMGDTVIPSVEPDWKHVRSLALDLLKRSKDLRIAVLLSQALLHTEGLLGLASGIALVTGFLAEHWDTIHPKLDPDDNNDPTERMNALLNLCDPDGFLIPIRMAPLVQSRTFGVVSLRDVEIAKGESPEPENRDRAPLDLSTIDAAFLDGEIERLRETATAVSGSVTHIKEVESILANRVGESQVPDLDPILDLLSAVDVLLSAKVSERGDADQQASTVSDEKRPQVQAELSASEPAISTQPVTGSQITSREDVVRILDRLCDYYSRNEPSSPVPLLLQRARRLVTKDFMGIVQDLAPDAVAQIEALRGSEGDRQ
jgi:type VI secretion system protein ImpA